MIHIAKVISHGTMKGETPRGVLQCIIEDGDPNAVIDVLYTSPYSFHNEGAFIGFPTVNTRILAACCDSVYYYLNSIVGKEVESTDKDAPESSKELSIDKSYMRIYDKTTGLANSFRIQHPAGHYLLMKDEIPYNGTISNSKLELKSGDGGICSLDDSREVRAVRLGVLNGKEKNELDGITVSKGNSVAGPRSVSIDAKRNINTTTREGSISTSVVEGGNIDIENRSVGFNANMFSPTGPRWGNIDLGSQFGDINLIAGTQAPTAKDMKSRIALGDPTAVPPIPPVPGAAPSKIIIENLDELPGSTIRITSKGEIEIYSDQPLKIKSTMGIDIQSNLDINIKSNLGNVNIEGLNVNINSPTKATILPILELPTALLRGYIPYQWMISSPPSFV